MEKKEIKTAKYFEGIGRRKTSVARVKVSKSSNFEITVNGKKLDEIFQTEKSKKMIMSPIDQLKFAGKIAVVAKVVGGGVASQAEALRHGFARALSSFDPELKKKLRVLGFLTRDSRMVERKKYGLRKARRAPQWAKR